MSRVMVGAFLLLLVAGCGGLATKSVMDASAGDVACNPSQPGCGDVSTANDTSNPFDSNVDVDNGADSEDAGPFDSNGGDGLSDDDGDVAPPDDALDLAIPDTADVVADQGDALLSADGDDLELPSDLETTDQPGDGELSGDLDDLVAADQDDATDLDGAEGLDDAELVDGNDTASDLGDDGESDLVVGSDSDDDVASDSVAPLQVDAGPDRFEESGASGTLTATVQGGVPSASCSWSIKGETTVLSTSCSYDFTALVATTTYVVSVTDGANTTVTDEVTVSILSVDLGADVGLIEGQSATLIAVPTGNEGSISCVFTRKSDGAALSTSCQPTVSPLVTTTYVVTIVDSNGNGASDEVTVSVAAATCGDGVPNGGESDTDCGGPKPWFNEIHYDDAGGDDAEGVEIAGPSGASLSGWSIIHYNSAGGVVDTVALTESLSTTTSGIGFLWVPIAGLINSGPAGVALVDPSGVVVQFLSWEGVVDAQTGPAQGMTSVDLPVRESGNTPNGTSLQLQGSGRRYEDFTWERHIAATGGTVNGGQTIVAPCPRCGTPKLCTYGFDCLSGVCNAGNCEN
ncbi:MAG: hypothetical protein KC609_00510 [Myxococcales bacterium]|nr:hypothetical protein [Myxococcales bacterium]